MNWTEQYLEDIAYLKSEDSVYGRLFDSLGILDQTKRKWFDVYTNMHLKNEQVDQLREDSLANDFPQLLPKPIRFYASTISSDVIESSEKDEE